MDTLALTDRDGTYGAVKFARACYAAGHPAGARRRPRPPPDPVVAAPVAERPRTPVRGGSLPRPGVGGGGLPRVTFLASADGAGGGRAGWAALCRLVSATHLAGERGQPVVDLAVLADQLGEQLAGRRPAGAARPASELGRAATRRRDDLALAALEPWRALVPRTHLLVELVSHRLPGTPPRAGVPAPPPTPPGWRGLARQAGLGAVLTNAVRYADRRDAPTVDVLDAARRLVAARPAPRRPGQRRGVPQVRQADGRGRRGDLPGSSGLAADSEREAQRLLAHTRAVADRCALDPRGDLGLGEVHFPEFELTAPRLAGRG